MTRSPDPTNAPSVHSAPLPKRGHVTSPFVPAVGPVAVVDDDPAVCALVARWVQSRGHRALELSSGRELLARELADIGCVCLDLDLPDGDGAELLGRLLDADPDLPVIVIAGRDDVASAVDAVQAGAYDYHLKPLVQERLDISVRHALERRGLTNAVAASSTQSSDRLASRAIVGRSEPMIELSRQMRRVVDSEVVVALSGETGTGKELVARSIHEAGPRARGPFVTLNCSAVPPMLHESELFGHDRGSGAAQAGRFEDARGGTLFLDEVHDLSPLTQASLFRALQNRKIRRVGGTDDIDVDVRVVVASDQDLLEAVKSGRFREDLYFRLSVFPIRIPPLRERRGDLSLLVSHFTAKYASDVGRTITQVAPDVLDTLARYEWPGNVRQLENVIHRAMLADQDKALLLEHLPAELRQLGGASDARGSRIDVLGDDDEILPVRELERRAIKKALRISGGSVEKAAKHLGMGRATLYRRLAHYDKNGGEL